jgi:hypothetical protein
MKKTILLLAATVCLAWQTRAVDQVTAFISAFAGGGQMVLNGFPVLDCDAAGLTKTSLWNPYVKQGNNDLLVILTNTPVNSARMEAELSMAANGGDPTKFAVISVKSKPEGGFVTFIDAVRGITNATIISPKSLTNGFSLKSSTWRMGDDFSVSVTNGTLVVLAHFFLDDFPTKKLPWDDSPMVLSAADKLDLQKYLKSLVDAFRSKDVDRCIACYAVRNHHLAESMGLPTSAVDDSQRKLFSELMGEKDVKLTVAKAGEIVPRSGMGWKVVGLKCQPLFSMEGRNASFIGEHFYARVAGKWVCVD